MKKLLLAVAVALSFIQAGMAQTTSNSAGSNLLPIYYDLKDALVKGNSILASAKAQDFIKALNTSDDKTLAADRDALSKNAGAVAKANDLKLQREAFGGFSNAMITLAKRTKLSPEPVYTQYCPMKKSYWLSSEKTIKNPYYGSAMLTCGTVVETL